MLTTAQVWEQKGMQKGMQQGEYRKARLVTLKGIAKKQNLGLLSELTGLNMNEVNALQKAFGVVQTAFTAKNKNIKALTELSGLSESEVMFVLSCLNENE